MPTITAGDFRNGVTFEKDGSVCTVVEFQHVKPGKGAAFVRTKYKNVMTGAIREESFNPTAKFEQATVERKDAEYSYNDGDLIACFDTNIPESVVKEIAQRKPLRAVFRDSGFASSPEKINVFEIFKLYMPEDAGDITKRVRVI